MFDEYKRGDLLLVKDKVDGEEHVIILALVRNHLVGIVLSEKDRGNYWSTPIYKKPGGRYSWEDINGLINSHCHADEPDEYIWERYEV